MAQDIDRWTSSDVFTMFPTLVWKVELKPELHEPLDARLLALVDALRADDANDAPLAPGRGWQSAQSLHQRPECDELVACIHALANSVLRFLRVGGGSLTITGCWANVLAPGAAHRMHAHPNNYLSGVYYVRTAPGADTINFHDPRPQTAIIRPSVVALTAQNTDQVVVSVSAGTLLLFPSWLQHSVDANGSDRARVSISFNLMFAGFAERLSPPQW